MRYEVKSAELKVCKRPGDVVVARIVGSCIAVACYDPTTGIGGILNTMLPNSEVNSKAASSNPLIFVDSAFPLFVDELNALGAIRSSLHVKVAGAAETVPRQDLFSVGSRNLISLRLTLRKFGLEVSSSDTSGYELRDLYLEIGSWSTWTVSSRGETHL